MATTAPQSFRTAAARHRKSLVYTVPWITGGRTSIGLNNVGYLNELQVKVNLTVTVGSAGTVTDAAAFASNFFPNIGLRSPAGEQIWYWSSRDIYDFNYRYQTVMTPASDPSYAAASNASATAQNVQFRLRLPVALNDGTGFDLGMLMRQVSNNTYYLDLQFCNGGSDLVGAGTTVISSITGTVYVEEIYYDAVLANSAVTPPDFSHFIRMRSITSSALINGQNVLQYAVGPVVTDAMFRFINNGAADATISNVNQIQLQSDSSTEIDNRTGDRYAYDQTMHLGKALRAGMYHFDACDDLENVNQTRGRDFINSNLAAQLQWNIIYAGTPTGTSNIQQIYREIIGLSS